jgi:outer membrane protein OmpA-like peptidoglycan-associated protein
LAEVEKNILENKEKESVGVLYFDFDASQEVKKQSTDTLKLIVNKLNELVVSFPHLEVIVDGHACNSCGSERYNLVLSDDRAKTVKTKIVESTVIPSEKIFETGYGTAHMIVSGNRAEQAPNRRAEVFVILNK